MSAAPSQKNLPWYNSYWVIRDRFAAGEHPVENSREPRAVRIRALLDSQVNHFIDLTPPRDSRSYADALEEEAGKLGLSFEYERYPIPDFRVPSRDQMVGILDAVDAALADNKTVYLHCRAGIGRTGTVVGCWLARHGDTGGAALDRIVELRKEAGMAGWLADSPETNEQREFVRTWNEPAE